MPTNTVVGSARAVFTISLVAAATEEVRVDWATKDGTALAGRDYETNSGTVAFAPGETSKTVEIFVHGRTVETEDRVFYVLLDPPVNALLADEIGACVIHVDTAGTVPVVSVIVPRGEKGLTGDSAYQIALNNGFVGTQAEWLDSLRPSPAEIAPLVAPLINAGLMTLTAEGTEELTHPDTDELKGFAGRIAYLPTTKKAFAPALTAGANVVPVDAFVGEGFDPSHATGFSVVVLRAGVLRSIQWNYLAATNEIAIQGAVAGDIPIAVERDSGQGRPGKFVVPVGAETLDLETWLANFKAQVALLGLFDSRLGDAVNKVFGAAMIGSRGRTVADRLDDTINAKDFGAIADGTLHPLSERFTTLALAKAVYPHATALTQSIDWAAIQGYLNSGAGHIHFPDGTYVVNDDLVQNGGNVSFTQDPKALVKFTLNKRMRVTGTADAMPALASNVTAGARSVPLASVPATALKDGDVLCLYDRRDYSWSPHRAYYRAGEFITVSSVSGTTVNIYGSLKYSYASANIDVYKITGGSVDIDGLKMSADPASTGTALTVTFCKDVNTRGVCSTAGATYAIEIDRCMGGSISAGNIRGALTGADDYGVIISNSTNIKVNSDIKAGRHCVALGGGAGICAIPYRGTRIYNSILRNLDGGAGAGDTHGNGDDTEYWGCTFDTHFNMAGKDTSAYYCHIYSRTGYADGSAVYGSEIVGGEFNLVGCKFYLNGDLASFGAIHLFPSQKLMYDWTVNVQGSRVSGVVTGATAKFIRINVQLNETKKTTVIHEGTDYTAGNLFAFVYMRCEDDPTFAIVSDGVISDHIKRGPAGAYLIAPGITGMANVKTRQMKQVGSVVVTAGTTPTEIVAAQQDFKFRYSKVPVVIPGAGNIDGSAGNNLVGGRVPIAGYYSVTESNIRPCVTAGLSGTFPTGTQAKLSWRVGIMEL